MIKALSIKNISGCLGRRHSNQNSPTERLKNRQGEKALNDLKNDTARLMAYAKLKRGLSINNVYVSQSKAQKTAYDAHLSKFNPSNNAQLSDSEKNIEPFKIEINQSFPEQTSASFWADDELWKVANSLGLNTKGEGSTKENILKLLKQKQTQEIKLFDSRCNAAIETMISMSKDDEILGPVKITYSKTGVTIGYKKAGGNKQDIASQFIDFGSEANRDKFMSFINSLFNDKKVITLRRQNLYSYCRGNDKDLTHYKTIIPIDVIKEKNQVSNNFKNDHYQKLEDSTRIIESWNDKSIIGSDFKNDIKFYVINRKAKFSKLLNDCYSAIENSSSQTTKIMRWILFATF